MKKPPKYRWHKPSNRGVVQFKPFFGATEHYLPGAYKSPESLAAYDDFVARFRAYKDSGAPPPTVVPTKITRPPTVARLLALFLTHAKEYYGEKSAEMHHYDMLFALLRKEHSGVLVKDFGPLALKRARELMIQNGWSRLHVNRQVTRLRGIFRWGVEHEVVPVDVYQSLRAVAPLLAGKTTAPEPDPVAPVDWQHVEAVLPWVAPMVRAMILVNWHAGMRPGEVCRMQGEHIERLEDVWIYRPPKHKNAWRGSARVIVLGPQAIAALKPYDKPRGFLFTPTIAAQERASERIQRGFRMVRPPGNKGTVGKLSAVYTTHGYRHLINYGFAKAERAGVKIPHWHPHQLRHSRATLVRVRYGIEGAEAAIGDRMEATKIYAEKSLELAIRIARESG